MNELLEQWQIVPSKQALISNGDVVSTSCVLSIGNKVILSLSAVTSLGKTTLAVVPVTGWNR